MNEAQKLLKLEQKRQSTFVELIASENFVSKDVLEMNGSIFTNKYAEGYPGKRYYGGCEIVDKMESLAIENAKKIFKCNFANVQPHSGSQANFAVYLGLLKPGDKILGMSLDAGGHLTHGHFVSSSGIFYKSVKYFVNKDTQQLDYDEIEKIALEEKPQLIIAGASAYSKEIDFSKFRKIADKVGAFLMADIAHIAGLVVANLHQSPIEYCDVVTTTTHKTLRGPRGGLILTNNEEIAKKVDRAVFPGTQGGPLLNIIAGKAVAFEEASRKEFVTYQKQVLKNVQAMLKIAKKHNLSIVSGGSDNHLFMINTKESFNLTGQQAEDFLYKINVIVNKNSIPFDTEGPNVTSGIRIGTPAMTTKGFNEVDFENLMEIIISTLSNPTEKNFIENKNKILKMVDKYE